MEMIKKWHTFCQGIDDPRFQAWYKQKLNNPWIFRAINGTLSPMPSINWRNTPRDTNLVEGAHAYCNKAMDINLPLLKAILCSRDHDIAASTALEKTINEGVAKKRWNGLFEHQKWGIAHKQHQLRDGMEQLEGATHHAELMTMEETLTKKIQDLVDREKELAAQAKDLQSHLKAQKDDLIKKKVKALRSDIGDEQEAHRTLRSQQAEVRAELQALKAGLLNGVQLGQIKISALPTASSAANPLPPMATIMALAPLDASPVDALSNYMGDFYVPFDFEIPPGEGETQARTEDYAEGQSVMDGLSTVPLSFMFAALRADNTANPQVPDICFDATASTHTIVDQSVMNPIEHRGYQGPLYPMFPDLTFDNFDTSLNSDYPMIDNYRLPPLPTSTPTEHQDDDQITKNNEYEGSTPVNTDSYGAYCMADNYHLPPLLMSTPEEHQHDNLVVRDDGHKEIMSVNTDGNGAYHTIDNYCLPPLPTSTPDEHQHENQVVRDNKQEESTSTCKRVQVERVLQYAVNGLHSPTRQCATFDYVSVDSDEELNSDSGLAPKHKKSRV
ncbi:hypothetical protein FA15DRAFT_709222 [Coprinopsis marcescibilis]|uniref:Uncharacterized protein n=1 Tax=Coprinopsis marcescibilis TaxID=230819 RepID=A0A5C3KHF6_COPMA|nr:hypothetical protein FA15DRAFT_709222 [Coprinopsis marcescibilis]